MKRTLYCMLVAALSAVVLLLAVLVTFGGWSLYVLTTEDQSSLQPGTVKYETRELWLSIDDYRNGRNESWTAEWPDVVKGSR